jgi:RimJ/RimL family protein N-acetyltransferase
MTAIPTLTTGSLVLRRPEAADFAPFATHYMSPRSVYEDGPYDRAGAWALFATGAGGWVLRGYGPLTVADAGSGAYLGEVGIYHLATAPEPELGWMVLPAAESRGVAFEAARALRGWAYATFGWTTLVSYIAPGNARSIRLAERLGARLDPGARYPDNDPCLVYRHPAPEALQ